MVVEMSVNNPSQVFTTLPKIGVDLVVFLFLVKGK